MNTLSRRSLVVGGLGLLGSGALAACSAPSISSTAGTGSGVASAGAGQRVEQRALAGVGIADDRDQRRVLHGV